MKRFASCLMGSLLLLSVAPALAAGAGEPLADFGHGGAGVPKHLYDLLPDGFFALSMAGALASGENFVATHERFNADTRLERVILGNQSDRVVDLVIAATGSGGAALGNYLVRLEAGGERTVDLSGVDGLARVDLLALEPFSARVESSYGRGMQGVERLEVMPPAALVNDVLGSVVPAKASCANTARNINICNASGCAYGRAIRRVRPEFNPPFDPDYTGNLRVQYPIGSPFHCPWGDELLDGSCQAGGYATRRCDGTPPKHFWSGIDDTIDSCIPSSVSCISGCTGFWTVTC